MPTPTENDSAHGRRLVSVRNLVSTPFRALASGLLIGCMLAVSYPAIGGSVVDTILTLVRRIDTKLNTVSSRVTDTRSRIIDLPGTVQSRLGVSLDGDVSARVLQVFSDVRTTIDQQNEQLKEFGDGSPGTGCFVFRADLITMVSGSGALADALLNIATVSDARLGVLHTERGALVTVIESLPCPVLLPIAVAFSAGTPLGSVAQGFTEAVAAVDEIASLYQTTDSRVPLLNCAAVNDRSGVYKAAGTTLASAAVLFRIISAVVDTDDMIGGGPLASRIHFGETEIGVHGYAGIKLEPPKWRRRLGRSFAVLSEVSLAVSNYAFTRTRHCEVVINQQNLFAQQQDILREICTVTRFRSDACRELPRSQGQ